MTARLAVLVLVLAGATSACGTTVPLTSQRVVVDAPQGVSDGGLGTVPSAAPGAAPSGSAPDQAAGAPTGGAPVGGAETAAPALGAGTGRPTTTVPGARRVTGPIKIGVLNTGSNAALAASFGKQGTSVTWQRAIEALVRYYNARGGLGGRRIVPTYFTVQATSGSYDVDFQSACAKFTQDQHVDLVMTTVGTGSMEGYETCLSQAKVVDLAAYDQGNTDLGTFASHPGLFTAGAPSVDRAIAATLTGLTATGYLSPSHKIGVVVEACPYDVRAFERTYAPLAKRLGLSVTRRDVQCVNNAADLGRMLTETAAAVLPFRSAGIDRVSFVSDFESVGLLGFSDQAQSQGWKPGYALTSASHAGSNASQLNKAQLPQMIGIGNLPNVDTTTRSPLPAAARDCRRILASQGLTGGSPADYSILDTACDIFRLADLGLTRSNGDASIGALSAGIQGIGRVSVSASVIASQQTYGPTSRDGAPLAAAFGYQSACACFRYTTQPRQLP